MTTWTDIDDSKLEPGAPARSVDAMALRDNPRAIAEGASGAPAVETGGLQDNAVTTSKINFGSSSVSGSLNAGEVARIYMDDFSLFPSLAGDLAGDDDLKVVFAYTSASPANPAFSVVSIPDSHSYDVAWRYIA